MITLESGADEPTSRDFLSLHLRQLPYFRALLRSVESSYFQRLPLPRPIYDVGCGDGQFASVTFPWQVDVGLDLGRASVHEAKTHGGYRFLVEADGASSPFRTAYFGSGFSNSALEHVPDLEAVLAETARVLKRDAPFYFSVPNPRYLSELSLSRVLGPRYTAWFKRMSRVYHAEEPDFWRARLQHAGFQLVRWWHYFPPASMRVLEWGHYFGIPSLAVRFITGRWILAPVRWNLRLTEAFLRKYASPEPVDDGTFTFYITTRR